MSFFNPKYKSGFTLLEILTAVALMACLVVFLARVFTGVDRFTSRHCAQWEGDQSIFQMQSALRGDIGSAVARCDALSQHNLNMYAEENDDGFSFYCCKVSDAVRKENASQFVEYIGYFWDKKSGNFYRASFFDGYLIHSDPYAWIEDSKMQSALEEAKKHPPILGGMQSLKMEFLKEDGASQINQWNDASHLPKSVKISIQRTNYPIFSILIFCRQYETSNTAEY